MMKVFIRSSVWPTLVVYTEEQDTVDGLEEKIRENLQVKREINFRITFQDKQLVKEVPLAEQGIMNDSTLTITPYVQNGVQSPQYFGYKHPLVEIDYKLFGYQQNE